MAMITPMKTRFLSSCILSVAITTTLFAQVGPKKPREFDDYTLRTLEDISQLQGSVVESSNKNLAIHGEIFPTRVKVVYEVTSRPLAQHKKDAIAAWANRFAGAPETYNRPYQNEVLFNENGREVLAGRAKRITAEIRTGVEERRYDRTLFDKDGERPKRRPVGTVLLVEKFLIPK